MNYRYPIYLDNQATTPIDPQVIEAMHPYLTEHFGNPHSNTHIYGFNAAKAVEHARMSVAHLIKSQSLENIIFTSGATEANNTAIKAVAHYYYPKFNHIITSNYEHACVHASCQRLEQKGFKVTYIPVEASGVIDPKKILDAIDDKCFLVSIMAVNNEIGTINNIKEIGHICRQKNILFHTDAAQAIGKIDIDVNVMNIDLLSLSGHKIYGPKGIGALYINKERANLFPLFTGGGQEFGLRSGTVPTFLAVGLGKACEIISQQQDNDNKKISYLRNIFLDNLSAAFAKIIIHGDQKQSVPHVINFYTPEIKPKFIDNLHDIAVSAGSACSSTGINASPTLLALGATINEALQSIRVGIGRFNTEDEIKFAAKYIINTAKSFT